MRASEIAQKLRRWFEQKEDIGLGWLANLGFWQPVSKKDSDFRFAIENWLNKRNAKNWKKWRYRYKSKKNRKQIKLTIANNGKLNWKENTTSKCAITAGVKYRYAENEQKWWQVEYN